MTDFSEILEGKTPSRCFLNDTIADIEFEYPVLDLGGGHRFSYHRFLDTDLRRTVAVNLPRAEKVDVYADAETTLPFVEESFASVFCFNLLEHVYSYDLVIEEAHRVLKEGGMLLSGVPFLHRVHGDPNDYTRFTEARLRQELQLFSDVDIIALDPGPVSAAVNMIWPALQYNWIKYAVWTIGQAIDGIIDYVSDVLDEKYPLYLVIVAKK